MLEGLAAAIHAEATHQRQQTTRRYTMADGSEYLVTLPNWRWGVLDRCRADPEDMQRLLDLVLQNTAMQGQPDQNLVDLFNAYLDDRIDFDAGALRGRDNPIANENFRTPWFLRVGGFVAEPRRP